MRLHQIKTLRVTSQRVFPGIPSMHFSWRASLVNSTFHSSSNVPRFFFVSISRRQSSASRDSVSLYTLSIIYTLCVRSRQVGRGARRGGARDEKERVDRKEERKDREEYSWQWWTTVSPSESRRAGNTEDGFSAYSTNSSICRARVDKKRRSAWSHARPTESTGTAGG